MCGSLREGGCEGVGVGRKVLMRTGKELKGIELG